MIVSGNVGIGTTSSINRLNIAGNASFGSYARNNISAATDTIIVSGNLGVGTAISSNKVDLSGNVAIGSTYAGILQAPVDGMIVSGNVGIGTTSSINRLNIGGNASFGSYARNNVSAAADTVIVSGNLGVGTSISSNIVDLSGNVAIGSTYAGILQAPVDGMIVSGNVGIGTTSSINRLNIGGNASFGSYARNNVSAAADTVIVSGNLGVGTSISSNKVDLSGNVAIGSTYAGILQAPVDGMIVSGNVGIGTTSSINRLNIGGNASFGSYARNNVSAAADTVIVSGNLGVGTSISSNKVDLSGNVAIGSTYAGILQAPVDGMIVSGNVGIGTTSGINTLNIAGNASFGTYAANNVAAPINAMIIGGYVGIGTTTPQYTLDLGITGTINTPNLQTYKITTTPSAPNINMTYSTLSNLNTVISTTANVSYLTSSNSYINVSAKSLCNITQIQSMQVITPSIYSSGNQVSFNFNKVLDVDTLIVRSNISVLMSGLYTYCNLPTNLVTVDQTTGKIIDQYIGSNIVRLMNDGTINPALFPSVPSNRATLLRTNDKVGIGLRNPQQKLHVYGNQCITAGYLGIGTTTPTSPLHIWDNNGTGGKPVFNLQETGSIDLVGIYGSNSTTVPVLYINGTNNIGVNVLPQTNSLYSLDVNGSFRARNVVSTPSLSSDTGTIDCTLMNLVNIQRATINTLQVNGTVSLPSTILASTTTNYIATNQLSAYNSTNIQVNSAMQINSYDINLYGASNFVAGDATAPKIGLYVNQSVIAKTLLTISDQRLKQDIILSPSYSDMQTILQIPVRRFRFIDNPEQLQMPGFLAQEVENIAPYAVKTTTGPIPNIMQYATLGIDNNSALNLVAHGLNINDKVKIIVDDQENIYTVINATADIFYIDSTIPTGATIFVYGLIVNDFKVLEVERLLPLVFNAVKTLNANITQQQRSIQDLLSRVTALEART
jgi:predicted nucleotidyltransferase